MSGENNILAFLIIEMLGRPKEHIEKSLKDLVEKVGEEKGVEMIESKIHDATEVEKKKDFFTTFAEIEIKVNSLATLNMLMFKYMPSTVTVIEPENITLKNHDYSDVLTEIVRRLHKYEELTRVMQIQLANADKKLKEFESKK